MGLERKPDWYLLIHAEASQGPVAGAEAWCLVIHSDGERDSVRRVGVRVEREGRPECNAGRSIGVKGTIFVL